MKVLGLFIFLCAFSHFSFPQIKGYVKSEKNTPIAQALVMKADHSAGVYTDENGYFELTAKTGEELVIKHVSYQTKVWTIQNSPSLITLILEENNIWLSPLTVATYKKKKARPKGNHYTCVDFSYKVGLWIKPNNASDTLLGLRFFISKKGVPTAPFRIGVQQDWDKTGKLSNDQVFEGQASKGNRWVEIYFDQGFHIQDSIFVWIEAINGNKKVRTKIGEREMDCSSICFGLMRSPTYPNFIWLNINEKGWSRFKEHTVYKSMIEPILN